jgi:hypothetical protein
MRCLTPFVVILCLLAAPPLAAQSDQSDEGHVYALTYWKTLPGQNGAYQTFMREHSYPFYDELVKRGPMVSYRFLAKGAGFGDYTHVFIAEYENWDAVDDGVSSEVNAEACQAAFGELCSEHRANYPPGAEMRVLVGREILFSIR